jgi:hypothetical protein
LVKSDWQYRKSITVKLPDLSSEGSPSRVVLRIRLHRGNFEYFQHMQPVAGGLRFIADDGTPLKHEIELFDPSAGVLVAWGEVPVKPGAAQRPIWMYYGNPHANRPRGRLAVRR